MNNIKKVLKLELLLIKPYIKAVCFTLAVPIAFLLLNRSLLSSVSFAMCFIAMSSNYTFSVAEKNGMERFYGIIPVTKNQLVLGKYIFMAVIGVLALAFSVVVHNIVLSMLKSPASSVELWIAVFGGMFMFCLYTAFQIPGYYKYGSIKGRVFMYIPVLGFLAAFYFIQRGEFLSNSESGFTSISPVAGGLIVTASVVILYVFSILCSIKIVSNKEV